MDHDDDTDIDPPVTQVRKSAADAQRPLTTAPRSVFDWRPAGAPLPAEPEPIKESPPTKTKTNKAAPAPRATGAAAPQFQILTALASRPGSWPRAELRAAVTLDDNQFSNAIYNVCKAKRARRNGDAFEITRDGLHMLDAEGVVGKRQPVKAKKALKLAPRQPAAKSKSKPTKKPAAGPIKAQPSQALTLAARPRIASDAWPLIEVATAAPFRCAAFSDGSFIIEKGGKSLTLTPEETANMRQYQERMQ